MISLDVIKETIEPITSELGLKKVIVFGSYARGDQTEDSDIDLVFDSQGALNGFDIFCAIGRLQEALPIKSDIFEISEIKNPSPTYTAIIKEGVVIYES